MTKLTPGTRVRVEYEAIVEYDVDTTEGNPGYAIEATGAPGRYHVLVPEAFVTEIDDPSRDAIGTIRKNFEGEPAIRVQEAYEPIGRGVWFAYTRSSRNRWLKDDEVAGWEKF